MDVESLSFSSLMTESRGSDGLGVRFLECVMMQDDSNSVRRHSALEQIQLHLSGRASETVRMTITKCIEKIEVG